MKSPSILIVWPLFLAGLICCPNPAAAQSIEYWDPGLTAGSAGGGAGTWSTAANWWVSGSSDTAWTAGDIASFGGSAGTVTLGASETADGLTFTTAGYTLAGSATLTLGGTTPTITVPAGSTAINCILAGTAGLAESGSGTLSLGGANTYSGGTSVPAGSTLLVTVPKGAGTGTIALGSNGVLTINAPGASSAANAVANPVTGGTNSVINVQVNLTTANCYITGTLAGFTGALNVTSSVATPDSLVPSAATFAMAAPGTLNIGSGAEVYFNTGVTFAANVVINGPGNASGYGALRLNSGSVSGNILLAGTGANVNNNQIGNTAAGPFTLSGVISDAGGGQGLNIVGYPVIPGTIILSGQNTYSGPTTLTSNTVRAASAENPGVSGPFGKATAPGSISFPGFALLQFSSANRYDYSSRFSSAANQRFGVDLNGQSVTFASPLTSSGGTLTLKDAAGGGTLILSGANAYTGATTLSNGTVQLAVAEIPGTSGPLGMSPASNPGSIVLKGGALQFSIVNNNDYSGRFSTAASQACNIDVNGQTVTFATPLTSSGGTLTLKDTAGGGRLVLSGAETYSGATTVNSGTLDVSSTGSLAGNVTVNGGALELDSTNALPSASVLTLASSPGAGAVNLNFTGSLKTGAIYFGSTLQPFGTWGAIGSGAANQSAAITGSGIITATPVVYPQAYFDPGSMNASPGSGGSGPWDNVTVDWWTNGPSDSKWVNGFVANFEGSPGTVALDTNVTANGLNFTVDGYDITGNSNLTLGGSTPIITTPAGGTATIGVTLAAANAVTINGGGALVLQGNNTYAAGTIVGPSNILQITTAAGAGAGPIALIGNAAMTVSGVANALATGIANSITGGSNSVININETPANNTFLNSPLSNFSGTINCAAGGSTVSAVVEAAGPLMAPSNATWNIGSGATLDLNAGGADNATVILNGPGASANYGALRLDGTSQAGNILLAGSGSNNQIGCAGNGSTITVSGVISDGGMGNGLNRVGYAPYVNTIVLSGQNTYSGPTTLSFNTTRAGSVENPGVSGPLGASAASNPGSIIFNGGALQFSSANQFDYSGRFSAAAGQAYNIDLNGQTVTFATPLTSGGGTLTLHDVAGGGMLILSGASTFNGGTTINSGLLDIANSGSLAGNVTINAGTLELDNVSALTPISALILAGSPAAGAVNLNFTGAQNISALFFGTISQGVGTWGAVGSGAANQSAAFTGSGILNITTGHFTYSYWDPNGADASPGSGGSGNWDGSTSDWWISGNADSLWAANGLAFFEGSAGNVTLNANETANALTFGVDQYSINASGPYTLTLSGATPTITVPAGGTSTSINCTVAGSAGLTESGAGTLILGAVTNTYSGGTTVNAGGTLQISSPTGAGTNAGAVALSTNSTFAFTAPGQCTLAYPVSGVANSVFDINLPLFGNVYLTGSFAGFNGTINCLAGGGNGAAVVEAAGPFSISPTATWNIAAGATVDFNFGTAADPANVIVNGAGSSLFGNLRLDSCIQSGNILLAGSGPDNEIGSAGNGATSTISGIISDGGLSNGLTRVGYVLYTNTLILSGENTYSGPTTLSVSILRVASAENPGTNGPLGQSPASNPGSIIFNGGTLQFSSANQFDYSGRFSAAPNQSYNIDVNGQRVTLATPLSSVGGALTLNDTAGGGKLILSAANPFDGGVTVNSGTLDVSSGSLESNVTVNVNGGALELDNPSALDTNANLAVATGATINLTFPGVQYLNTLVVAGNQLASGLYGARATNAGGVFTGPGAIAIGLTPPVSSPITISSAAIANHQFTVSWSSVPNAYYNVFTTTNLTQAWTLATTNLISSQGSATTFTLPGNINATQQLFVLVQQ